MSACVFLTNAQAVVTTTTLFVTSASLFVTIGQAVVTTATSFGNVAAAKVLKLFL
ncbi:MAG: hypothetical protein ACR2LR_11950 [Hassallia sp.]